MTTLTRQLELYGKCSNLLRAFARFPPATAYVILAKYIGLRNQVRALSPVAATETAEAHREHVCAAAGIRIERDKRFAWPVDIRTGRQMTWCEFVERVRG